MGKSEIYSTVDVSPALLAVFVLNNDSSRALPGVVSMFGLGWAEILVILVVGVLLFGRRLPEVGRYLGKGIVEFKKGLKGIEDEVESVNHPATASYSAPEPPKPPQRIAATAPKFQEPAAAVDSEGKERYQA
jgi:sec-independent protein translocase protein TatA